MPMLRLLASCSLIQMFRGGYQQLWENMADQNGLRNKIVFNADITKIRRRHKKVVVRAGRRKYRFDQ